MSFSAAAPSQDPNSPDDNMELASDFGRHVGSENHYDIDIDVDFLNDGTENQDDDYVLDDVPVESESAIPVQDDDMYDEERPAQPMEEDIELYDEEFGDAEQPKLAQDSHLLDGASIDLTLPIENEQNEVQVSVGPAAGLQDTDTSSHEVKLGSTGYDTGQSHIEHQESGLERPSAVQEFQPEAGDSLFTAPSGATTVDQDNTPVEGELIDGRPATVKPNGAQLGPSPIQSREQPESGLPDQTAELPNGFDRLHPVTVLYENNEMSLFPPYSDDPTDTYFLKDESLVNENISELFKAMRLVLGDSISEDDQLEFDVDGLDLYLNEHSSCVKAVRLADILDLHVSLYMNDGVENPNPLYMRVTVRPDASRRMHDLAEAVTTGKGISQLFVGDDQDDYPADYESREDEGAPHKSWEQEDGIFNDDGAKGAASDPDLGRNQSSPDTLQEQETVGTTQTVQPSNSSGTPGNGRELGHDNLTSLSVVKNGATSRPATDEPPKADIHTNVPNSAAAQSRKAEEDDLIDYGEDENEAAVPSEAAESEYQIDCGLDSYDGVISKSHMSNTPGWQSNSGTSPLEGEVPHATSWGKPDTKTVQANEPDQLLRQDAATSDTQNLQAGSIDPHVDGFDEEPLYEDQTTAEPQFEAAEVETPVVTEERYDDEVQAVSHAEIPTSAQSYDQPDQGNQDEENATYVIDNEYYEGEAWEEDETVPADELDNEDWIDPENAAPHVSLQTAKAEDDDFNSDLDYDPDITEVQTESHVKKSFTVGATNATSADPTGNSKSPGSAPVDDSGTATITYESDEEPRPSAKMSVAVNDSDSRRDIQSQLTTTKRLRGTNDEKDPDQSNQGSKRMRST